MSLQAALGLASRNEWNGALEHLSGTHKQKLTGCVGGCFIYEIPWIAQYSCNILLFFKAILFIEIKVSLWENSVKL